MSEEMGLADRTLAERMKRYEAPFDGRLPVRTYTVVRVDIRAAHSYLRKAERPFDAAFMADMDRVAEALCRYIPGAVLAFTQSDEISVLVTDFQSTGTQSWFDGRVSKWVSLTAARASVALNRLRLDEGDVEFDSRVFTLPTPVESANYLLWRQRDAVRNSISMAAQKMFSPAQLHGVNTDGMQEMLWRQHGINWSAYPEGFKRGRVTVRTVGDDGRSPWETSGAPHFKVEEDSWLAQAIPPLPSW